ncbi:DNA helicase MCM9-like [Mercenaria mercenaria]|uniref:DNA helicase MCM9-like n=1 Tax=Mercenaria mercenaria TaxID=6596 RepID=UPI00234F9AF7|nr:DNA helicase MCM9-like [Mercenaria mercenaria]
MFTIKSGETQFIGYKKGYGAALLGGVNALHTAFPDNAEEEYQVQAQMILERLNLPDLLEDEMRGIQELDHKSKSSVATKPPVNSYRQKCNTEIPGSQSDSSVINSNISVDKSTKNHANNDEEEKACGHSSSGKCDEDKRTDEVQRRSQTSPNVASVVNTKVTSETVLEHTGGAHQHLFASGNQTHDISNISLSDMLNSSSDDTVNSCREFPHIGTSLGIVSQASHHCSAEDSHNFKMLPANTSTPLRLRTPVHQQEDTSDKESDAQIEKDGKTQVTTNSKPCFKTVIRQTIENRLTQIPKKIHSDVDEEEYTCDVTDKTEDNQVVSRLVCVKEKKLKNLGEYKKVSGKVKKVLSEIQKSKKADVQIDNEKSSDNIVDVQKLKEGFKRKRKKKEILSDSSDDGKDTVLLEKRPKKTEKKLVKHDKDREESPASLTISNKADSDELKSKAVSNSTLSKLRKFQFDEAKSSALNKSSGTSLSSSLLSGSLWTNENENDMNEKDHGLDVAKVDDNEKPTNKTNQFQDERLCNTLNDNTKDKVNEKLHINVNKSNEKDSEIASNVVSSAGLNSKSSQSKTESPSWLVALNKKFTSPKINTFQSSSFASPVFSVNEDKKDDLDDIEFEETSFLHKLQTAKT